MMKLGQLLVVACCLAISWKVSAADYQALKAKAERFYDEGSYKRAHELYLQAQGETLPAGEVRWVQFRLAETQARSEASTRKADDSELQKAEVELRKYVAEEAPQDHIWAEAQEALGDLQWTVPARQNWGGGWPYYEKALDFWAGSTNLSVARERYWRIIFKAAEPPRQDPGVFYGSYGNYIPISILENALKIAPGEDEEARAHFMIAMTLRSMGGSWEQRYRIPYEFEAALKLKKDTRWYDDALYFYAEWMNSNGRAVQDPDGNWTFQPDYEKALQLFQRITSEFRKGESRWFESAQSQAREITRPILNVSVAQTFLPGSEIEFQLNWRNVTNADLAIYEVDLVQDVRFPAGSAQQQDWLQSFNPARLKKVKSWTRVLPAAGRYAPGHEAIRLDEKLEPGAYLLIAKGQGAETREILMVTESSTVLQSAGRQCLVYFCNSASGAPIANGRAVLWERYYQGREWKARSHEKETDAQGMAVFELDADVSQRELFAAARAGKRQAFSAGSSGWIQSEAENWKIYAFTDRPAYRPGEKAHWKFTARQQRGEAYSVPRGAKVIWRITDPRGAELKKSTAVLNSFGSAWGDLDLGEDLPLGVYQMAFFRDDENHLIGQSQIFRLEEYKLPEFKVAIRTPEENGRKKTFVVGEKVEVAIAADYYFGGPVANASVEVVVYQSPFYFYPVIPYEYDWFFTEREPRFRRSGSEQVVQRETLKTDQDGKARLTLQTPLNSGNDLEYRIEARVTDASRREITAEDTVRVGRQRFYVQARPVHQIYRPQDKVEVEFKCEDANRQPVSATGDVRITRDYWWEIWIDPNGREVQGDELKQLRRSMAIFPPPPPRPNEKGWRLKFRGYQHDDILRKTVTSGTNGIASISFTPERDGYYRISWRSDEEIKDGQIPARPASAVATVWVATNQSTEIGYRSGGLEILVDKKSVRAGEKLPVMLTTPSEDRYVLFTVTGTDLLDYQLVHMSGSVRLLEIPVAEKHVPNIFLNAAMVSDQQVFVAEKEVVVPPVKQFLTVSVTSDREQYQPGEEGTLEIKTQNSEGRPVPAEVALAMVDESVFYIQPDFAGDPRPFFFGTKRPRISVLFSSFNFRPYRSVKAKDGDVFLERESVRRDEMLTAGTRLKAMRGFGLQGGTAPAASLAMPAAVPALNAAFDKSALVELKMEALQEKPADAESAVQVRSDFRSSILWRPDLQTGADGRAKVKLNYPDTLTSWKATARVATEQNQFGIGFETTRTKQPLIVRLQAPRFFLVGDTVTVSAVINNNTDEDIEAAPSLTGEGIDVPDARVSSIKVPTSGEARADWVVHPRKPGLIKLKATVRGGRHADAMEKQFTVYEHGIEKFFAASGKGTGTEVRATLEIPAERNTSSTHLSIQVTPSLAVTMLDALPYLIDYPYGCTEQTMSRFLPAIITTKTLKDLGLAPEDVMGRVFGGIEPATAAATHPGGKPSLEKLNDITTRGLQRLKDFQHSDGGWGWWKEGDSDSFMTAYIVWGLTLARQAGEKMDADLLERGRAFLQTHLVEAEDTPEMQAWLLHALAAKQEKPGEFEGKAFENLWENRERLNAYARALFALSAHYYGKTDQAKTLARNLENGVKRDAGQGNSAVAPGAVTGKTADAMPTAHWGEDGITWRWSEGGVEATATALRALLAIDPQNELVDAAATWLIKNRRGAQWSNTRDTAMVVLALNDYLRVTKEVEGELGYEVFFNGRSVGSRTVRGAQIFSEPASIEIPADLVQGGENQIRIARTAGKAPIYFAAQCRFFSLEEPVKPAGNEIFVARKYFRLRPVPTLLKGYSYNREELGSGDVIESGERIETVVTIEAKNNYEYLIFEDLKPAGLEAVEVRSGESLEAHRIKGSELKQKLETAEPAGEGRSVHQELRDRKVALFIDKLPEGFWEIRYETRAEVPGEFHALPVLGHAMYVPEIRANSMESRIVVRDELKSKKVHEN